VKECCSLPFKREKGQGQGGDRDDAIHRTPIPTPALPLKGREI